jgi:hypothetical protein
MVEPFRFDIEETVISSILCIEWDFVVFMAKTRNIVIVWIVVL